LRANDEAGKRLQGKPLHQRIGSVIRHRLI
jgi:hypothetical protein